jgi:hypothetical protein
MTRGGVEELGLLTGLGVVKALNKRVATVGGPVRCKMSLEGKGEGQRIHE